MVRRTVHGGFRFPPAFADSPEAAADELAEDFDLLGEPRRPQRIHPGLGRESAAYARAAEDEVTRVHGCMSEVHLVPVIGGQADVLEFVADANADIVRGLIAVLATAFFRPARERKSWTFDIESFLPPYRPGQFISSQRATAWRE